MNNVSETGQDTVKKTIYVLDRVDRELTSLFEDNCFFKSRGEYLSLFQHLAVTLHQSNNLRYLKSGSLAKEVFISELETTNLKIIEVRAQIIQNIIERMEEMVEFSEILESSNNHLMSILNSLSSKTASTMQLRVFIKNDERKKQSLIYSIEDTRNKIILPALKVVKNEIEAGNKILDTLKITLTDNTDSEYSLDELARICEMIALGMDNPTLWETIREELKDNELRKEVSLLRPHGVLEETELESLFS